MDILDELNEIRKEKHIRQKELCSRLNITEATMSRYQNNKRTMPIDVLINYIDYIGYEIKLMKK